MAEQPKQIPRVYLDQSILSEIAKGKLRRFADKIRSGDMQLIYSYVHIAETARRNNQEFQSKVMQTVADMNGAYIHESKLHFDKSPQLRLDEYFANHEVYNRLYGSIEQLAHKFFGGQQGKIFRSLIEAQQKPFADLMLHMDKCIKALSESEKEEIRHHLPMLEMFSELMQLQFEEQATKLLTTLEASIPSSETLNGAKGFRAAVEIAPSSLNNIRPPNVMQKIWEQVSASGKISAQISSASDFLAQGVWAHMKDSEPSWEDKIGGLYNLLNLIGYWPDEELHKDGGFRSAMGDQTHAAFAAFAHVFITGDERMAKKTYAIYKHLGIGTPVCWCKSDGNGGLIPLVGEKIFQ
ncbi:MAG: hypothetical protein ABL858_01530 [Candidatus Nitrotoga sp.]